MSRRDPVRKVVALATLLRDLAEGYGLADDGLQLGEVADVSIDVDPDRLRQVLANLVDNGLAAPGRTGPVIIRAACERRDLILRVEDDGHGMPAALASRAFAPFVTTKPAGQGTGLGLAIARRHTQDHGGTVTIERTGPDGTVIVVQLPEVVIIDDGSIGPARPDTDADTRVPPAPPGSDTSTGQTPTDGATRGHVLIVDDEPGIRGLLEASLRRDGWEVTSVEGPAAALDVARGVSFDLALLDVVDGGRRLLDELEEHQPGLRSRSASITGSPPSDGVLDGRPVLGKPFAWQDLTTMLAQIAAGDDETPPT